jgi:hypothetical protein
VGAWTRWLRSCSSRAPPPASREHPQTGTVAPKNSQVEDQSCVAREAAGRCCPVAQRLLDERKVGRAVGGEGCAGGCGAGRARLQAALLLHMLQHEHGRLLCGGAVEARHAVCLLGHRLARVVREGLRACVRACVSRGAVSAQIVASNLSHHNKGPCKIGVPPSPLTTPPPKGMMLRSSTVNLCCVERLAVHGTVLKRLKLA